MSEYNIISIIDPFEALQKSFLYYRPIAFTLSDTKSSDVLLDLEEDQPCFKNSELHKSLNNMDIMKNNNDEQNNEKIISNKEMFMKEEKDTCSDDACVKPQCPKCGFALTKTQKTIRKYHHQN